MVSASTKGQNGSTAPYRLHKIVMDVYMRRSGWNKNVKFVHAEPFKYVTAARLLSTHPKFRGDVLRIGALANDDTCEHPKRCDIGSSPSTGATLGDAIGYRADPTIVDGPV